MINQILNETLDKSKIGDDKRRQSKPKASIVEETMTLIEKGPIPQNSNSISESENISPQVGININEDKEGNSNNLTAKSVYPFISLTASISELLTKERGIRAKEVKAEEDKRKLIAKAVHQVINERYLARVKASKAEAKEKDLLTKSITIKLIEERRILTPSHLPDPLT